MTRDIAGGGFSEAITEPAPPPRDHNNPPGLLVGEPLLMRVKTTHFALFERAASLLEAEARAPKGEDGKTIVCLDDDWERKLTETAAQLSDCHSKMDVVRMAEMEPYRTNMNSIHGMFRDLMDKMVDPDKKTMTSLRHRIERALNKYKSDKVEAERKRREAEAEKARQAQLELERKQREEEAKRREEEDARRRAAEEETRKAQEAARQAELAASRKRSDEAKAAAEAEAARLRKEADDRAALQRQIDEQAARDRAAREEADRKAAAEAAEKTAAAETAVAAPAASLSRTRSANAMSGQQEFTDFRDLNRETVDLERLRSHIPSDAIEQAIRSYIKANDDVIKDEIKNRRQPVRGVVFFINTRTQVRR